MPEPAPHPHKAMLAGLHKLDLPCERVRQVVHTGLCQLLLLLLLLALQGGGGNSSRCCRRNALAWVQPGGRLVHPRGVIGSNQLLVTDPDLPGATGGGHHGLPTAFLACLHVSKGRSG